MLELSKQYIMSVIQSQQKELRYLKRKGLEQESRIVGNALRDQIRSYGVDCIYYKLKETGYTDFKNVIDQNTVLRRAYGYDEHPDYTMSVHMITYPEVQTDIFQLNKYGHIPNAEIDFHFDKIDFACSLASKYGQLKEYQLQTSQVFFNVPPPDHAGGFDLGRGPQQMKYYCDMLTGWCTAHVSGYSYGEEFTVECCPYQHTDFNVKFPANEDLYRSLSYEIQNTDFLETKLYMTAVVNAISTIVNHEYESEVVVKNVLSGYIHGSLLFFDIDMLGKYVNIVRPAMGDLIAIDFPDDSNREMYEITDCFDKQLTQDGISPLLHNYIWKCKAKRYVNAHEELAPVNEADQRVEEMQKYDQLVDGVVADQVSLYDTLSGDVKEDAVYGGYENVIDKHDIQEPRPSQEAYDYIDDGTSIVIMKFKQGSQLVTNGYDLIFVDKNLSAYHVTTSPTDLPTDRCLFEQDLRWLKATDNQIVFVNVEGQSTAIAINYLATKDELELCLNSLYDKTLDSGNPVNSENQSFFKFKGTRSYMWSNGMHLFAKLASSNVLHFIA